jgi:transposase
VYGPVCFGEDVFMVAADMGGGSSLSPRRRRSVEERRLIVEETLEAGASVARVAMKYGVNANQVFKWRRLHESGRLGTRPASVVQLLPVRVAEEQPAATSEPTATPLSREGSIEIELPGHIRIKLGGHVDAAMVRLVLKSLRP